MSPLERGGVHDQYSYIHRMKIIPYLVNWLDCIFSALMDLVDNNYDEVVLDEYELLDL